MDDSARPDGETSQERSRWRIVGILLAGIVAGQAVGAALFYLLLIVPSAVVAVGFIPVAMGFVSALVWRPLALRFGGTMALLSLAETVIALCLASGFLHEGTICLLIAAPLIWLFLLLGMALGGALVASGPPRRLSALVAPALILAVAADGLARRPYESVVETRRTIAAAPDALFPSVVACGRIDAPATFWMCRLGLPAPENVRIEGDRRDCVFTGNLVFVERVTERQPGKRLTFTIVRQPDHPELLGHARVGWGQMELIDRGDGTTTLIGRSGYTLFVHPGWYFDAWAQAIGHAVHERVFDHIARRATGR